MHKPHRLGLLLLVTGCVAHYDAENPALEAYPGIAAQIRSYYDDNATEDDWQCDEVQMNSITESKVVYSTPTEIKVAVHYYFQSFDTSPDRGGCEGFNTRFFTFARGNGGALALTKMSGPSRTEGP